MIEVVATDEWLAWYDSLDEQADDAMTAAVDTLRVMGVGLRAPLSSAINGSRSFISSTSNEPQSC